MRSKTIKSLLFAGWVIAVGLVAFAIGITSVTNWIVVAAVAIVPPFIVGRFWLVPEKTMSESINEGRR